MTTETPPDDIEIVHSDTSPPVVETPVVAAPGVDESLDALKTQLAAEKAARVQAENNARAATTDAAKFKTEAENSQYAAISRGLEAANGEIEAVESRLASAMEAGDYKAAAKAQTELAKATAKLSVLENGKSQMDAMRADPRYRQAPPPVQTDPFEQRIAAMSPRTQQWLRAHPDAVTDPVKVNKVTAAHYEAMSQGLQPDSEAYFTFVETHAGYRQASRPTPPVNTSAPVNGVARQPSGQPAKQTLTMTPRMRQLAKEQGVSEAAWAKAYLAGLQDGTQEPLN